MNILDNFASLLICFHNFGVRRPEPWIQIRFEYYRIRIQAGFLDLGHQWNIWHKNEHTKERLANYLERTFNFILNIFHRSGSIAPDPYPDPETSATLNKAIKKCYLMQGCIFSICHCKNMSFWMDGEKI